MAYNKQYRTRVVEYVLEGHTQVEASSIFKVSIASINRWQSSYKASGSTGGGYTPGVRGHKKIDPGELKAYMDKYPDAFLKEVARKFSCCIEAARKALARNGYTLKKRRHTTKSAAGKRGPPTEKR
jgi:transposase